MKKIIIHDCTQTAYNANTFNKDVLGGIEIVTISLAEKLSQLGFNVIVRNNTKEETIINNVKWINYTSPFDNEGYIDYIIANNDPNIFNSYKSEIKSGTKLILWNHNSLTFNRFIKRARWLSYLKYNIHGVFLSEHSFNKAPWYIPFKSKKIISHFHSNRFLDVEPYANKDILEMPFKNILFISQPYRGLDDAIDMWKKYISPNYPKAKLYFYSNKHENTRDLESYNIVKRAKKTHNKLLNDIKSSYALFYQGHKDETFCFAASEALSLGIPVVTMGIGALKNRVEHNVNGIIESTHCAWAMALLDLLNNEDKWKELRKNSLQKRKQYHSDHIMPLWLDLLNEI